LGPRSGLLALRGMHSRLLAARSRFASSVKPQSQHGCPGRDACVVSSTRLVLAPAPCTSIAAHPRASCKCSSSGRCCLKANAVRAPGASAADASAAAGSAGVYDPTTSENSPRRSMTALKPASDSNCANPQHSASIGHQSPQQKHPCAWVRPTRAAPACGTASVQDTVHAATLPLHVGAPVWRAW